ncbi:MAG: NDP-sugar synthase [Actinobacteria bacterium]|nr:NDP-sugar synthase [Actinomycetota bacterium]
MRAVVLVGGFGTRLRPLTLSTPKQMLQVGPITMFERVIERLGRNGVTEAIVSLGFAPDRFTDAFPDGECAGVKLHYAIEPEPLDTGGAIRFAARHAGVDDTFLVVNGDVLTDLDYSWLVDQHRSFGGEATLHLISVEDPSRFGVVDTAADGKVRAFVEKPAPGTEPCNLINAGTYVMEPSVLDLIAADRKVSVERETFPALVERGTLFAAASDVYWIDAGTPAAFLQASLDLIDGTRSSETAVQPSAKVADDATIDHALVGTDSVVGAGAVIVDSIVMAGAQIGAGAEVRGSIIGCDAVVGAGASVIGGSVVGHGEHVDAGATVEATTVPDSSTWL